MTTPDHGVDLLLRRSADSLDLPDVDRLVAGGVARGRTRQRRARAGTALVALAVAGVVGTGVVLVPQLGADASRTSIAGDPTGPTPTPTPAPTPSPAPTSTAAPLPTAAAVDAELAVPAGQIPALVDQLLGTSAASAPLLAAPYGVQDDPREKIAHFHYQGMLTSVVVMPLADVAQACDADPCTSRPDGTVQRTWESTADGVTARGVTVFRHGYSIDVLSYNAADGKDSPPLSPTPPLSTEQLLTVAGSGAWFG